MNNVCLVGTLTRHPAVRFEGDNGAQVTAFILVIPEPGRDGTTFTLYVNCIAWGKSADAAAVLNGGDLVSLEGKLCWRKHKEKSGQDKSTLAVLVRTAHCARTCCGRGVCPCRDTCLTYATRRFYGVWWVTWGGEKWKQGVWQDKGTPGQPHTPCKINSFGPGKHKFYRQTTVSAVWAITSDPALRVAGLARVRVARVLDAPRSVLGHFCYCSFPARLVCHHLR